MLNKTQMQNKAYQNIFHNTYFNAKPSPISVFVINFCNVYTL